MGGRENSHLDMRLLLGRRSIGASILARTLAERRVLLRKQVGGRPIRDTLEPCRPSQSLVTRSPQ